MKIILRQDYKSIGKTGDIITVKNGYARNFLIPKGIAITATARNMKILKEEEKLFTNRKDKDRLKSDSVAKELSKISITVSVPVGEEDRVFGSVTSQTIAEVLNEKGYAIDRKKIQLDEPIKALGVYTVPIKLHSDVEANLRVWVVKE
jgi:large subunit ribosomal protein L9